jgi:hypothetical protein
MWLINRLQYIKQLVIELESLVEANGVAIKKPLSTLPFSLNNSNLSKPIRKCGLQASIRKN